MTYFTEFFPAEGSNGIEGTTVVSSVSRTMELKLYKWASVMPTTHLPLGRSTINWDTNVYTVPGDNRFILMIGGVEIDPSSIVYTIDNDVLNGLTVDVDLDGNIITSGDAWTTDSETFNITATYSGTPYTLAYTVRKAKVGVSTILTDLLYTTDTVSALADGTGYVLPLENKLIVRSNGEILTSGVTFSGDATQNGLSLSINSEGDIYLTGESWTSDSETFVLTATYAATPYTINYTVRKSKIGTTTAFYNIAHDRATALASSDGVDYSIPYSANGWELTPSTAIFGSNLYKTVLLTTGSNVDPISVIDWDSNYTVEFASYASESSIVVELTNPMHIFPSTRGIPGHYVVNTYADSGTNIHVWEGLTELTYDGVGTDPGTWTVTADANVHIDIGTITADSGHAVVPDFTNYDDTWSDTTIVYNIVGTSLTGTAFTGTKTQRFSKSTNIGIYELEISSSVLAKQSESAVVSGSHSTVEITGKHKEGEYSEYWGWLTITPNGGVRGAAIDLAAYALANPSAPNVLLHPADGDTEADYLVELWTGDPDAVIGPAVETVKDSVLIPVIYKGSPGTRTVDLKMYKWLDAAPSTYPSGPSVYTWSTASFTTGAMTLNGWSTSISTPAHGGMTLYSITKRVVDYTSDLTTNITWSGTAAEAISTSAIGGVSALLSNETHNFNADSTGAVSVFTNSGTTITVSEGSSLLTYGAFTPGYPGSNGTWNLYYGLSGITGIGSVSGAGGTTATIGNVTGVTTATDAPYITWYIYGKTASGNTFFLTKQQTFTKIKTALSYELDLSSYAINKQAPDASTDGTYSTIDISGYKYDGGTRTRFGWVTYTPNTGAESARQAVGSAAYTLAPASSSDVSSYIIKHYDAASGGNLIGTKNVGVVFKGASPVSIITTNSSVPITASPAGVVSSYANTGCVIKVLEGTTELDYDGTTTGNGKWNVTSSVTSGTITAGSKTDTGTSATYGNVSGMSTDTAVITYTITGSTSLGVAINITWSQYFTKIKEGLPALRVEISRYTTVLPADSSGVVSSYAGTSLDIKLFEGSTTLSYDGVGSAAGTYNVTAAVASGSISLGSPSDAGTYVTYSSPFSAMTSDTAIVNYTVSGTYSTGAAFSNIIVAHAVTKAKGGIPGTDGADGADGADSQSVNLSSSAGTFTYNSADTASPGTQTITFTAELQNISGTVSFSAVGYNSSGVSLGSITLSGTGNSRTMTNTQFLAPGATKYAIVTATLGAFTKTVTIVKVKDGDVGATGTSGLSAYLTNDSYTVVAFADGSVPSANYSGATGSFKVISGTTDVSSNFTLSTQSNPDVLTIGYVSQVYTVSASGSWANSGNTTNITIRATGSGAYTGVVIDRVFTIAKAKGGYDIVASLPVTNLFEGRIVYLSTDDKLYRYTGASWITAVAAVDITGTITETQIANDAITTPKIAANAITAAEIAVGTITANEIATDAITSNKILAGAITAAKVGANEIIANSANIATGVITNAHIANLDAAKINAGTINTARIDVNGVITAATGVFSGSINVAGTAKIAGTAANTLGLGSAVLEVGGAAVSSIGIVSLTTDYALFAQTSSSNTLKAAIAAVATGASFALKAYNTGTGMGAQISGVTWGLDVTGGTNNPAVKATGFMQSNALIRSTGSESFLDADTGIYGGNATEVYFNTGSAEGFVRAYTRHATTPVHKPLNLQGSSVKIGTGAGSTATTVLTVGTADVTTTMPVILPAGSAGTPSISITGDTNTGIYQVAADSLGISTGGTLRVTVSTTAVVSTLPTSLPLGALATPSYSFTGDLDTGMWSSAANTLDFSAGGTGALVLTSSLVKSNLTFNIAASGSVSAPALYFVTDTSTGFYRGGTDIIRVAAAGANIAEFNSNGVTFVKHPRLTATAPTTSSDTGSSGQIAFDATYLYVCTAGNTWKRIALTAF